MATSARKQAPLHLERTRVSLLSSSISCAMIAGLMGHWAKAAGYLTSIPNLLSLRSCSVSIESPKSPTSAEHIEAQKVLVKQMCCRATHNSSDVRLDTSQIMRPDVWPRELQLTLHAGLGKRFTVGNGNTTVTSQNWKCCLL